ncbi:dipeptidase 1-like [Neocloeon triangulifer]|uniref:dipeptidase 1-like n=1 Tax=Neocloeon triangulifer TaxID=2078957 RepID=UPI00286F2F23|nr:dipeptidase 1-like [Neocloeon triangulifer]
MSLPKVLLVLALVALSGATVRRTPEEARRIANKVLDTVPLVDGHNDLVMNIKERAGGVLANIDLNQNLTNHPLWVGCEFCHTDIPRLRAGKVGAQFFVAFGDCSAQYRDATQKTLDTLDLIIRFSEQYSDTFKFVTTPQGILDAFAEGKIASLVGIEGGQSIDNRLSILRQFYKLGVRYMSLNHMCHTPWSDTSFSDNPESGLSPNLNGLSDFGRLVVREMNRLGIMVDLAHVSKAAQEDVLAVSRAPIIYSHSNAYALCNHDRNVHDNVLQLVKNTNSIVMVNFYTGYVNCNITSATLQDVINQINYIVSLTGYDNVGIGSDFDGINSEPEGLEDVSGFPNLFAKLAEDPAWTEENLRKLASDNFIRVFRDVERVRDEMAAEGITPFEGIIPLAELGNNTACYTGDW